MPNKKKHIFWFEDSGEVFDVYLEEQGVAIGRPTLYGAAAAGEAGARRALEILTDEIERTLRLCGARTMAEVGSDLIVG